MSIQSGLKEREGEKEMRGGGRGGVRGSEVRWDVRDQKSVRGRVVDKKDGRLKDVSGVSMECR